MNACATYSAPQPVGDVATAADGRTRDEISAVIEIRRRNRLSLWMRVDDEDYDEFSQMSWWIGTRGYAFHPVKIDGKTRSLFLHRLILGLEHGESTETDHINRDKLDNRRSNLRSVTHAQNQQNVPHASRFRGVLPTGTGTWHARIVSKTIGTYRTEEEAAVAAFIARRRTDSFASEPQELIELAERIGEPTRLPMNHWHSRQWSRELCIELAHEWFRRYGQAPGAVAWNPAMARSNGRDDLADRFHVDGCWPYTNTVMRIFGRWNDFIRAAGFEPLPQGVRRDPDSWLASMRSRAEIGTCKHGHSFSEHEYVIPKTGKRVCRACQSRRAREYSARKKQMALVA